MTVQPLDRSSPTPLWAQLAVELERRLEDGQFDERFPSDVQLIADYGVSRHTAREAVRHLRGQGLVERHQGRGSFVRRSGLEQPLGALYSLFRSVEAQGMMQTSEVLALDLRVDGAAAERLAVPADAELVHLARRRLADDVPLALDTAWLPADLGAPLLDADFHHTALYDELRTRCGIVVTAGWERLAPVLPNRDERRLLGIRAGEAAFAVERCTWAGTRAVEWRRSLVRGDGFSFVAEWGATAGDAPAGVPSYAWSGAAVRPPPAVSATRPTGRPRRRP